VRIALQEADSEKRRLISGGICSAVASSFIVLARWLASAGFWCSGCTRRVGWAWIQRWPWWREILVIRRADAGASAGQLLKGPYLPQTTARPQPHPPGRFFGR